MALSVFFLLEMSGHSLFKIDMVHLYFNEVTIKNVKDLCINKIFVLKYILA